MWRRVVSLSPLVSSSKSRLFNQIQLACGFNVSQAYCTRILYPAEDEDSDKGRNPFITFVLGGPGSGKGTQCAKIVETFGFTHLSAGDLLRKEISSNSENGSMILNIIKEGKIVPSEMTVRLLQKAIEESKNDRFLIDGFPRTEENRITYERVIGTEPDIVLFFHCPEEEMIKRVLNRNQGRIDDNIDTVKERMKVFTDLSLPVIEYYSEKGKLYKFDAIESEDEIFERVRPIFASLRYAIFVSDMLFIAVLQYLVFVALDNLKMWYLGHILPENG